MTPMRLSSPAAMSSISGPLKFTHLLTSMYSLPVGVAGGRRGRGLRAALVQQHDERLDLLLALQLPRERLAVSTSSRKSRFATPDGVTTVGVPSRVMPMKPIFVSPTFLIS